MFAVTTYNLTVVYNDYYVPVAIIDGNNLCVCERKSKDSYYESEIISFFDSDYSVKIIAHKEFTTMLDSI